MKVDVVDKKGNVVDKMDMPKKVYDEMYERFGEKWAEGLLLLMKLHDCCEKRDKLISEIEKFEKKRCM